MFETINRKTGELITWEGVFTQEHPCPICGKPTTARKKSYCCMSSDKKMVCCGHATEGGRVLGRAGRVFTLTGDEPGRAIMNHERVPRSRTPSAQMFRAWTTARIRQRKDLAELAGYLPGTTSHGVESCGACWITRGDAATSDLELPTDGAWCFPMTDHVGKIVGLRLRDYYCRSHFAMPGSQDGIFGVHVTHAMPATRDIVMICEGASDAAALASEGIYAIGKPSAKSGHNVVVKFCVFTRCLPIIVADDDADGHLGAEQTADAISKDTGIRPHIIKPPCGPDARASRSNAAEWIDHIARETGLQRFAAMRRMPDPAID